MDITNPRLASLEPAWAPFRGFTLLFDNPGDGLQEVDGWRRLSTDPDTDFYRGIRTALRMIGGDDLRGDVGLCCLPSDTYHVTAWDGINDTNLGDVRGAHREQAESYLSGLPVSLRMPAPFTEFAERGLCDWRQPLQLCFESLVNWRNRVLAVQLQPTRACAADYAELEARRAALNQAFHSEFGTRASVDYRPHVTLGYFANQGDAARSNARLAAWNEIFARGLDGRALDVGPIRLYGFTDLTRFLCP